MKQFYIFILLVIALNTCFSQTPDWLWAAGGTGGSCFTDGDGVAVSSSGDIYFSGRFGSSITIGGQTLNATSGSGGQGVSGRMDSAGNVIWITQHAYNGNNDYNYAFTMDDSANTYMGGILNSGSTIYIDKYDSLGNMKWSKIFPGGQIHGLFVDKAGYIYATGEVSGTMNFSAPGTTITSAGNTDMFLAKFDNNCNCIWAVSGGGLGIDGGRGISVDPAGNIYVCGAYNAAATFGPFTLAAPPVNSSNGNFFLIKYNSSGTPLWVNSATNAGFGTNSWYWNNEGLAIDSCANIYVTGSFSDTSSFGNLTPLVSAGGQDIFVAKCLSNGQWEWAKRAGGTSDDNGRHLVLDKYNDVYISGNISSTAQFDSLLATSANGSGSDIFIAKYANSTGDVIWVKPGGGPGSSGDRQVALALDNQGFAFVVGTYNGTINYGSTTFTNTNTCSGNIFVAKLDTAPLMEIVPYPDSTYCPGSTAQISFSVVGSFNSGNVFTVQLSDSNGSFVSPVTIGSAQGTTGGLITISIPPGTPSGSNYIIRITSSSPAYSSHFYCNYFMNSVIPSAYQTVKIAGTISANISSDTTVCQGSQVQLSATGGTSYSWSPATDLSCADCNNPVDTAASSTTYTVSITNGTCTEVDSIAITVAPPVIISLIPDTTVCTGSPLPLNPSGDSSYSYTWSSSPTLSCTNCSDPIASPLGATTYSVTATNAYCIDSAKVRVNVGSPFAAGTITALTDTLCQGAAANLSVTGSAGIIQWQSSSGSGNFTDIAGITDTLYSPVLSQTTYFRVIADNGYCSDTSASFQVVVNGLPTPPVLSAIDTLICSSDSARIQATGAGGLYTWNNGDTGSYTFATNAGGYWLTVTDANGCTAVSGHINIYVYPVPSVSIIVRGDTLASFNAASYQWFLNDSAIQGATSPVLIANQQGDYSVQVTDTNGCQARSTDVQVLVSGVQNLFENNILDVYPDPFSNTIFLRVSAADIHVEAIEIYDELGRLAIHLQTGGVSSNPLQIDVSDLAAGIYYLKIKTNKSDYVRSIIK